MERGGAGLGPLIAGLFLFLLLFPFVRVPKLLQSRHGLLWGWIIHSFKQFSKYSCSHPADLVSLKGCVDVFRRLEDSCYFVAVMHLSSTRPSICHFVRYMVLFVFFFKVEMSLTEDKQDDCLIRPPAAVHTVSWWSENRFSKFHDSTPISLTASSTFFFFSCSPSSGSTNRLFSPRFRCNGASLISWDL